MLALLAMLLYKFCHVYMPRENLKDVKCSLVQAGIPLLLLVELYKKKKSSQDIDPQQSLN